MSRQAGSSSSPGGGSWITSGARSAATRPASPPRLQAAARRAARRWRPPRARPPSPGEEDGRRVGAEHVAHPRHRSVRISSSRRWASAASTSSCIPLTISATRSASARAACSRSSASRSSSRRRRSLMSRMNAASTTLVADAHAGDRRLDRERVPSRRWRSRSSRPITGSGRPGEHLAPALVVRGSRPSGGRISAAQRLPDGVRRRPAEQLARRRRSRRSRRRRGRWPGRRRERSRGSSACATRSPGAPGLGGRALRLAAQAVEQARDQEPGHQRACPRPGAAAPPGSTGPGCTSSIE